jgi:prepilin-type N-terminal cleavage/methylation domain-containing protein
MRGDASMDDTRQDGFTLVELLVSMMILVVISTVAMSVVVNSSSAVKTSTQVQGLNEEARLAINRMARDLRQASSIVTAVDPDGPAYTSSGIVAIRLNADFDGDGCLGGVGTGCLAYSSGNPEDITYCYEFSSKQLYVIDNQAAGVTPVTSSTTSCSGGQPLLAGNVDSFKIEYRSNQYRYDLNPSDGVTTWRELDEAAAPIGNQNGQLDSVEMANIDSVVLNVTMKVSGHPQVYRTQVDLRNRSI